MKHIEVQIMGQGYLLACPEGGEARLHQAVSKVDAAMCKIRDAGKVKARDRIAVLAAINLAFELCERLDHSQTAPPAAASPAQASTDQAPAELDPAARSTLSELIRRIDRVLIDDGRLL